MKKMMITVKGLVQGIGYRPFVARLAEEKNLTGSVKNSGGVVEIVLYGEHEALQEFLYCLKSQAPAGAAPDEIKVSETEIENGEKNEDATDIRIKHITLRNIEKRKEEFWIPNFFSIVESSEGTDEVIVIPPDLSTCDQCEKELFDRNNRRYRHPFISCTGCGPRFSIMEHLPYDRDTITMRDFEMCDSCKSEYTGMNDRRRHAQTIACMDCGPFLRAIDGSGEQIASGEAALRETIRVILDGGIAAIKDIGGYHFALLPSSKSAVNRLRRWKNRDRKPFAVMFPDVDSLLEYADANEEEIELLKSSARPIVLLEKKKEFQADVCSTSDRIGAFLPCNPLQMLLLKETGSLIMTSANRGGEPICITEDEIKVLMQSGCPDLMLMHDRRILTPLEDSICQVTSRGVQFMRRSRGYVPLPIWLKEALPEQRFAAGGDLKAVFAYGKEKAVYLSSHFGDLDDAKSKKARAESMMHMKRLLRLAPTLHIMDMHPNYVSARELKKFLSDKMQNENSNKTEAADTSDNNTSHETIQHHYAHVLSVMAEHGIDEPVIGIAFDGTGFGIDGTIWGGEFLYCSRKTMGRMGNLLPIEMPGGDTAAKKAGVALAGYLIELRNRKNKNDTLKLSVDVTDETMAQMIEEIYAQIPNMDMSQYHLLEKAVKLHVNTSKNTSMGRLFDAVSALLGICYENTYEGECAIMLEQAARRGKKIANHDINNDKNSNRNNDIINNTNNNNNIDKVIPQLTVKIANPNKIDSALMLYDLWTEKKKGISSDVLAYAFHRWVVDASVILCERIQKQEKTDYIPSEHELATDERYKKIKVMLAGGTFANRILHEELAARLEDEGFEVYENHQVPCGDGGLALGQIYIRQNSKQV